MLFMSRLAQDDGLTLHDIIASIPVDPAAIVAYFLLAGFAGLIWWGNRHAGGGQATGPRGASSSVPEPPARKEHDDVL